MARRLGSVNRPGLGFRGLGGSTGGGGGDPPTISIAGTVAHGETLTATASDYSTLQWYADASPISGETALTYVVDRADVTIGPLITCRATGPGGTTDSNALSYYPSQDFRGVWDAAEDVTLVGSDVDAWGDQGLVGAISAVGAAQRPVYNATDADFNGEPSVEFDGAMEYLRVLAASFGGALAYWATGGCWRVDAGAANNEVFVAYSTLALLRITIGAGGAYFTMASVNSIGTTNVRGSTLAISGGGQYGGSQSIYVSGVAEDTDTNAGSAIADGAALAIGSTTAGALTLPVKAALVVADSSANGASSRAALDLDAYCAWRFGAA